jgi:hypothetical protein
LVSVYEEDCEGQDLDRWGTAPEGQFVSDAGGKFSLLIVGRNIIRLAGNNAKRACNMLRACREMMDRRVIGYFGQFSIVQRDTVAFNIEDALAQDWSGTKVVASVTMDGAPSCTS